jgi:Sec-independent protein secretion pathway component TatC
VPLLLLFEGSIWSVRMVERRVAREAAEKAAAAAGGQANPAE